MAKLATHAVEDAGPRVTDQPVARPWFQRLSATLMLPREHGAWAMLMMPYILGTLVAGWGGLPSFLVLASVLMLFAAGRPLEAALRAGGGYAVVPLALYLVVGGAAGVALLVAYQRWMLLLMAAAAGAVLGAQLLLRGRRLDRSWPARLVSIAALSATGPAAYYAATTSLDIRALAVWVMPLLYSGASVFYVRLYYRTPPKQQVDGRRQAEGRMVGYLAVAVTMMAILALVGWLPPLGVIVMIPVAVKVAAAWRKRESRPSLRRIGMAEMGHSTLFVVLATIVFTAWR
jgi:hypothetical protein